MVLGPLARGFGNLFRLTPGPQQLPFPELVRSPRLVGRTPTNLPPRRSRPLPPLPEDIAQRRPFYSEPAELPRTQTLPFEVEDPVTGVRSAQEVRLFPPGEQNTDELLKSAERDLPLTVSIVINSLKTVDNPSELYKTLLQIRVLRERYGATTKASTGFRLSRGPQTSADVGGQVVSIRGGTETAGSLIPPDIEAALDTEIWRAAARSGIPASEIGKVEQSLDGTRGVASLTNAAEQARYSETYTQIGAIARKAKDNPDDIRKAIEELQRHVETRIVAGGFMPWDTEKLLGQSDYWLGVLNKKLGAIDDPFVRLQKLLSDSLDEATASVVFKQAISNINNEDELRSIPALARQYIKSQNLLDDIDAEAVERLGYVVGRRARLREPEIPNRNARRGVDVTISGKPFMQRSRPGLTLRSTPVVNPYGSSMSRALPFTRFDDFDKKFGFSLSDSSGFFNSGPGRNYRSIETTDPETGQLVHRLLRWNNASKKWEQVDLANATRPSGAIVRRPEVDPSTGKFIRESEDYTEFQGFTQRIPRTVESSVQYSTEDILRESIELASVRNGIPREQTEKVVRGVISVVKKLESEGKIQPGSTQYNWMTSVFGKIALNISGPGVVARTTRRGQRIVSRDKNFGRRQAAIVALDKAETAGFVPEEASTYLRSILEQVQEL